MFELQWEFITENRARRNGDAMRQGRESRNSCSIFGWPITTWNNMSFLMWPQSSLSFFSLIIALFHLDPILHDICGKPWLMSMPKKFQGLSEATENRRSKSPVCESTKGQKLYWREGRVDTVTSSTSIFIIKIAFV